MKNIVLILLTLIPSFIYGQVDNDRIEVKSEYSSKNEEINGILNLEGIDYYRFTFLGNELINKHYMLMVKELWNGTVTMIDTIMDSSAYDDLLKIKSDTFKIKVIAKKLADDRLKVIFTFPRVKNTKYYKSTNSDDYSLRNLSSREDFNIKPGKPFYFLAYIMPYEKDGAKYWCTVARSGENVEDWGDKYGLEHYLVYEMVFK